ncbi:MAG: D-alanine-D-alanine ligase [Candidatus Jorgensenbacteria bacterium GW2011_GWA2_45_9]|nr:MAG: D-alanine-D-alanine ligase [Candidatus Jorgensenbacteria bacterium GW2011_GWA2_45_9]
MLIAVLSGGPSSEYEVSLKSGEMVREGLDINRYEPVSVRIDKSGVWEISPEDIRKNMNCAFIAMHGTYGEDGTVQRILESHRIPYTGSDSLASAIGMNKFLSSRLFKDAGLSVPDTVLVAKNEWRSSLDAVVLKAEYNLGYPMVVKPNNQGSSVDVFIVKNRWELKDAVTHTLSFYKETLVQKFVSGREFTCGVLDHGWADSAFPLAPIEIIPQSSPFFDYKAKYETGGSLEITPPENVSSADMRRIRDAAVLAHRLINASGVSRTDMIMDSDGRLFVLEINTIPGLTRESLIPKGAGASGISFSRLLDMIVRAAIARHKLG